MVVDTTSAHHVSKDTMNTLQDSICLWILSSSRLAIHTILLKSSVKWSLNSDPLSQTTFLVWDNDLAKFYWKGTRYTRRIYQILRPRSLVRPFLNSFDSGEFNHFKPSRRRVYHGHAHKFLGSVVTSFNGIWTNEINTHLRHGTVSASFGGRCPYLRLRFFPTWQR